MRIETTVRRHLEANDSAQRPIDVAEIRDLSERPAVMATPRQPRRSGVVIAVGAAAVVLLVIGLAQLLIQDPEPEVATTVPSPTSSTLPESPETAIFLPVETPVPMEGGIEVGRAPLHGVLTTPDGRVYVMGQTSDSAFAREVLVDGSVRRIEMPQGFDWIGTPSLHGEEWIALAQRSGGPAMALVVRDADGEWADYSLRAPGVPYTGNSGIGSGTLVASDGAEVLVLDYWFSADHLRDLGLLEGANGEVCDFSWPEWGGNGLTLWFCQLGRVDLQFADLTGDDLIAAMNLELNLAAGFVDGDQITLEPIPAGGEVFSGIFVDSLTVLDDRFVAIVERRIPDVCANPCPVAMYTWDYGEDWVEATLPAFGRLVVDSDRIFLLEQQGSGTVVWVTDNAVDWTRLGAADFPIGSIDAGPSGYVATTGWFPCCLSHHRGFESGLDEEMVGWSEDGTEWVWVPASELLGGAPAEWERVGLLVGDEFIVAIGQRATEIAPGFELAWFVMGVG